MSEEYQESSEESGAPEVSQESESQPDPSTEAPEQQAQAEEQEEKPAPFHEHPRFKELIEQNRAFKEQSERSQQELTRMQYELQSVKQSFAPKKEEPVDPLIAAMGEINPKYAESLKSLYAQAAKAEQIEKQFQQYQQQQFAEKAYSHFDSLLSNSKINDPTDRDLYKSAVEAEVYRREARGEKLGLNDLDKIFSGFHAKYSKYQEDRERAITARYATSKKADQAPTSATGGAATSPVMKKFSSIDSPDTVKWLADQLRASKKQE